MSLEEKVLAASLAGMSYGKYVAMNNTEKAFTDVPKKQNTKRTIIRNSAQYDSIKKKIVRIDTTGERIVFDSVKQAAEFENFDPSVIRRRARKGIISNGVRWEYGEV